MKKLVALFVINVFAFGTSTILAVNYAIQGNKLVMTVIASLTALMWLAISLIAYKDFRNKKKFMNEMKILMRFYGKE